MSWHGIEGHDEIADRLALALKQRRLASTYLFVGPDGIGKGKFALQWAKVLLCANPTFEPLSACGTCHSCRLMDRETHPDLIVVKKPADKSEIPVALLLGDDDERFRVGLCHEISLKPHTSERRVAIIFDADDLNEEGANSLLKTLEEPPPHSVLILIGTSPDRQLPTIRSRCQIIRFKKLADSTVESILRSLQIIEDPHEVKQLAAASGGSVATALTLHENSLLPWRRQVWDQLSDPSDINWTQVLTACQAFADQAGSEASAKRGRSKIILGEFLKGFLAELRACSGIADGGLDQDVRFWPGGPSNEDRSDIILKCANRCLEALEHVDRNANQANWMECWIDDLSQFTKPLAR